MPKRITDSGIRNGFGYYDTCANEIVLKHPYYKKSDVQDVYNWIDSADSLRKLSIGMGILDGVSSEDNGDGLANASQNIIHQKIIQTQNADNEVLKNILLHAQNKPSLKNISLNYYTFTQHKELFDVLLQTLRQTNLIYLDLTGCYFTDEQLIELAEVISQTHIAHLGWPEPRMSELLIKKVADKFKENKSVVAIFGVPLDFQKIAQNNREWLFALAKRPMIITEKETGIIKEYAASFRVAIAYEKQRIFDLEKVVEAILV